MADNKQSIVEQLKAHRRDIAALERQKVLECDHTDGVLIPIDQYNGVIKNPPSSSPDKKITYPKTSVVHQSCGAIFDAKQFSEQETFDAIFTLESMCHQIKTMTGDNMQEKNRDQLNTAMEFIEYLRTNLIPYYNSMAAALGRADKTKKNNSYDKKLGGIGITSSQFSI